MSTTIVDWQRFKRGVRICTAATLIMCVVFAVASLAVTLQREMATVHTRAELIAVHWCNELCWVEQRAQIPSTCQNRAVDVILSYRFEADGEELDSSASLNADLCGPDDGCCAKAKAERRQYYVSVDRNDHTFIRWVGTDNPGVEDDRFFWLTLLFVSVLFVAVTCYCFRLKRRGRLHEFTALFYDRREEQQQQRRDPLDEQFEELMGTVDN